MNIKSGNYSFAEINPVLDTFGSGSNLLHHAAAQPSTSLQSSLPVPESANHSSSAQASTSQQSTLQQGTPINVIAERNAFQGAYIERQYSFQNIIDPELVISSYRNFFHSEIRNYLMSTKNPRQFTKMFANIIIELQRKILSENREETTSFVFHLPARLVNIDEIDLLLDAWEQKIITDLPIRAKEIQGSGYSLKTCSQINLLFCKYLFRKPGGAYRVILPKMRGSSYVFNPSGILNSCLIQCLAAYKYCNVYDKPYNKCHLRMHLGKLKSCSRYVRWDDITFPVKWEDISKIERLNEVSIYVYEISKEEGEECISLVRRGCGNSNFHFVPLLFFESESHFCLITNFNKFVGNYLRKKKNAFFCRNCLSALSDIHKCSDHEEKCNISIGIRYLPKGSKLRFQNYHRTHMLNHICFFDFESILQKKKNNSLNEAKHIAYAACFIITDRYGNVKSEFKYCGEDVVDVFLQKLLAEWKFIKENQRFYPIHMSEEDQISFLTQTKCQKCQYSFCKPGDKIAHHDHAKAEFNYISALCNKCNLYCKELLNQLPAFAHNASYDLGLILKQMKKNYGNMKVLTKQDHKYLRVNIGDISFQDSLQLMSGSLETLANSYFKDKKVARFTRHMLRHIENESERLELLTGKGHMCYEYLDDPIRLQEKQLPARSAFYNRLKGKEMSISEYDLVKRAWEIGKCEKLENYLMLYLQIDVGLLADVFTDWRQILYTKYGLDMAQYVSLPAYAFDTFLKISKAELDQMDEDSDELFHLIRNNIRGGYSGVVVQSFDANNAQINSDFNPEFDISSYILYLDFNSLYASVMEKKLPKGEIRKLSELERKQFLKRNLSTIDSEGEKGYWFLIDTKPIGEDIARATDDLPLGMYHKEIDDTHISPYSYEIFHQESGIRRKCSGTKLVASHEAKKNYLIALPLLQLFVKLGLEIENVHEIYEFKQEEYMLPFINLNVNSRNQAISVIEKLLYKLMNNAVFGKFLQNLLKYNTESRIITNRSSFLKAVQNPRLKDVIYLNENRVITTSYLASAQVRQPNYIGFHILEMAKYKLYSFWYEVIKRRYGPNAKLLYTDTDSYIFALYCKDIDEELNKLRDHIDFSNFSKSHPLFDDSRKGQLGLLKSETGEKKISKLRALKPKMYYLAVHEDSDTKRAKGIPNHELNLISLQDFENALNKEKSKDIIVRNIQNIKGQIYTRKSVKTTLSAFDNKRWHIDRYKSFAFGHPDINIVNSSSSSSQNIDPSSSLPRVDLHTKSHINEIPLEYQDLWKNRRDKANVYFTS